MPDRHLVPFSKYKTGFEGSWKGTEAAGAPAAFFCAGFRGKAGTTIRYSLSG
jgi:hypothetical protein